MPAFETAAARRWRSFKSNKVMAGATIIVVLYILIAIFAPLFAPSDPLAALPNARLQSPSLAHPFGTDTFSRDELSRTIFGTRVSIAVGFLVSVISTVIGAFFGLVAGYFPRVDRILMRVMDGLMAFPGIILAIAIAAALGSGVSTVVIALVIVYAPYTARIMRAPVLASKGDLYVVAAQSIGASDSRILRIHVLPNSIAPVLVQATFVFSFSVLAEATLSFLGVGVPPPTPSWGNMLNAAQPVIQSATWLIWAPGAALLVLTIMLNLVGDGIRDLLDPRHFTGTG